MSTKKDWKKHFHRMKQIADQNLGRAEKSEVLNEDLVLLEKRVNKIKAICQSTIKKLSACLPLWGSSNPDKSFKKLPESMLAVTMMDSAVLLGNKDNLGITYNYCGNLQSSLAQEIFQYTQKVENLVLNPMQAMLETQIPTITKLRKHLTKLTLDMDSAKGRFQSMLKQSTGSTSSSLSSKLETLKNEMEQAEYRVQQCRDQLIIEMYSFLASEGRLSDVLLALINSQIEFHGRALQSLESILPQMQLHSESSISRPVFGCSLKTHLHHSKREIALVIEKCVRLLILNGINEEGLFRVPSSSTKVRKLKAGFDANIVNLDDYQDDSHCVAAVLKSYLRELPEPLMTFELYDDWMHIMRLPEELRQNALWVVVDKLPKPNYNNLRYIIKFLAQLAANSDCNKMSPSNIAIVIGPNLLWPSGENGPSVLTATSHSAIIEILINKSEWFFPGELDFGVSESDLVNRNRLSANSTNGRSLSSASSPSSRMTPSFISKHRFFGSIFDNSVCSGLKMSPSVTRLSLSSLTSLNDDVSSFERKYSFSSLLDERTSNWDSEDGSSRWRKLSRVESGLMPLNTGSVNRSPIRSTSSTSPAISMSNAVSTDTASPSPSVTKSPATAVTSSARLSPSSLTASAYSGLNPTAAARPHSAIVSGTNVTCESVTSVSSSIAGKTSFPVSKGTETRTTPVADVTRIPFSSRGSFPSDYPPSARSPLTRPTESVENENSETHRTSIECHAITEDSHLIPDLLSPFFQSSGISISNVVNSECPTDANHSAPSGKSNADSVSRLSRHEAKIAQNGELIEFQMSTKSCVVNPKSVLVSTLETFVSQSPDDVSIRKNSDEFIETASLRYPMYGEDSNDSESVITASNDLTVENRVEESLWINELESKLTLESRETVQLHGNYFRPAGTKFREGKRSERRASSEPRFDSERVKTKHPMKKSQSLSANLPYEVTEVTVPTSKDTRKKASYSKPSDRHNTMATEKIMATADPMATEIVAVTTKNGNDVVHPAGSSLIFSPGNNASSPPVSTSNEVLVDFDCFGGQREGVRVQTKEFCLSENVVAVSPNCIGASSTGFLESSTGTCNKLLHVATGNENGVDHRLPQSEPEIPHWTVENPSFPPPPSASFEGLSTSNQC